MFFLGSCPSEGPEKGSRPSDAYRALALGAPEGPWALRAPHVPRAPGAPEDRLFFILESISGFGPHLGPRALQRAPGAPVGAIL